MEAAGLFDAAVEEFGAQAAGNDDRKAHVFEGVADLPGDITERPRGTVPIAAEIDDRKILAAGGRQRVRVIFDAIASAYYCSLTKRPSISIRWLMSARSRPKFVLFCSVFWSI